MNSLDRALGAFGEHIGMDGLALGCLLYTSDAADE